MSGLSIIINASLAYLAFRFARNDENVISRILGLGYLIARGGLLLFVGALSGNGVVPLYCEP